MKRQSQRRFMAVTHQFRISIALFGSVGVRLGALNGSGGMLNGRIDRIQLNRLIPRVDQVMPCSSGDENGEILRYISLIVQAGLRASHHDSAPALLQTKKLIQVGMHLQADFSARRNAHQGELQMGPRPKRPPEKGILQGRLLDVNHIRVGAKILPDASAARGQARLVS